MKDAKKLNNLLGMEEMSAEKVLGKKNKPTKRTDVAKDVLAESAYVLGKDVLGSKLPNKEDHIAKGKGLNNLICIDDFTKSVPATGSKATKRTEVAKDVLLEKKKAKAKDEKEKTEKEDTGAKGLTAKQRKLPEAFQKAILKRQGK